MRAEAVDRHQCQPQAVALRGRKAARDQAALVAVLGPAGSVVRPDRARRSARWGFGERATSKPTLATTAPKARKPAKRTSTPQATKPPAKRTAKPAAPKPPRPTPTTIAGPTLGTATVATKHGTLRVILGRDRQPVRDEYQAKNWAWARSTCKSRSVAAACGGPTAGAPHAAAVTAPLGYTSSRTAF